MSGGARSDWIWCSTCYGSCPGRYSEGLVKTVLPGEGLKQSMVLGHKETAAVVGLPMSRGWQEGMNA